MNTKFLALTIFIFSVFSVDARVDPEKLKKMKDRAALFSVSRMDCQPAQAQYDLEINNVRATLLTGGDFWWDLQRGGYFVPKPAPGFAEVSALFASGLWMGGNDPNGALKLAGVTYRTGMATDYYAGPLDSSGQTDLEICNDWDRHFVVKGENINSHRANYEESIVNGEIYDCDLIPNDVKYWPARGNPFFNEEYDFELPDQNLADFFDEDGDGLYNPCAGDYPTITQRGCNQLEIPDEMVFWIFNDNGGPHRLSQATAIQMEIQSTAFAYVTNDEINNMTFYKHEIINKASDDIRDFYVGLWLDADLGCSEDDYIGCDIPRSLAYVYNEDAVDGSPGSACPGGVSTYGENIPIVGVDLFRGPRGPKVFRRDQMGNIILDINGNPILDNPKMGTGEQDTLVDLGMTSFSYQNRGVSDPPEATQDPILDFEFYNILRGLWKDGTPVTFGISGFDPASKDTVKYVFSDPPNDPMGWSMCTADLPFDDRRTVQSVGPLLLQPGAQNEMIFGVVYADNIKYPCPAIDRLQFVDDLAQALFDNCFSAMEAPEAPDMAGVELDQQLVILLTNNEFSNNFNLQYIEKDLNAPAFTDDPFYRFEGYKIYQLADANVGTQSLDDIDNARLVAQVDMKNGVGDIYNWFSVPNPDPASSDFIWVPERRVMGADQGIKHSFSITKDQFSSPSADLQNGQEYYYTVVAYAYNNYQQYSPSNGTGQRTPYLESQQNVKVYAFTPRSRQGATIPTSYGQEAAVTRIEGIGTSFNALDMDLTDEEIESILESSFDGRITYKPGHGPINPKVVDPLNIKNGEYRLQIVGEYEELGQSDKFIAPGARYELTNMGTGEVIASALTIEEINEQIIEGAGFSISVNQVGEPGDRFDDNNGAISQTYEYDEGTNVEWWNAVPAFTGTEVIIDENESEFYYAFADLEDPDDPMSALTQIDDGFFVPFKSARWLNNNTPYITPAWKISQGFALNQNKLRLADLNNVDIVFTPDKSKWSKCVVVETAVRDYSDNGFGTVGSREQFELRAGTSIDVDGNEIPGDQGMSYFPGYAIDVETGERLNIFFGENSVFNATNDEQVSQSTGQEVNTENIGNDMIWNPSGDLFTLGPLDGGAGTYNSFVGGQHYIYVTRQEYDECAALKDLFGEGGLLNLVDAVSFITWTAVPIPAQPLRSLEEGLIPSELTVKLRVSNPYNRELDIPDPRNPRRLEAVGGFPLYEFAFEGVEATVSTKETSHVLNKVQVSPNPSVGSGNTIHISNLEKGSIVTLYTLEGELVKRFSKALGSPFTDRGNVQDLTWNLSENEGLKLPSGMYIIHVSVPHLGVQKSLKWIKL